MPQTAAIYMVAAWAAIQFADVVVPNLNGPSWIVAAVIIAAVAGLPVVLVLAWIFEWGPQGVHRTAEREDDELPAPAAREWVTALAVLLVGIASAVGVAAVFVGADRSGEADASGTGPSARPETGIGPGTLEPPTISGPASSAPPPSEVFEALDSLDAILEWTRQLGGEEAVVVFEPGTWRFGRTAHPLAAGDTLEVSGIAQDSAGIVAVDVDGRRVAESDPPQPTVPFAADIVGTEGSAQREVSITAHTADARVIRRTFLIRPVPGG